MKELFLGQLTHIKLLPPLCPDQILKKNLHFVILTVTRLKIVEL